MMTPDKFSRDQITFKNAAMIAMRPDGFVEIEVDTQKVLNNWKESAFAHDWMDFDKGPKPMSDLKDSALEKSQAVLIKLKKNEAISKPILGIGMHGGVEIGSGRAAFVTLSALGATSLPVFIPASNEKFFKKFKTSKTNNESGNVLFYIFIAIALIAALSFAVSDGSNTTSGQITDEKAKLAASEIIAYGDVLANAVGQLRLRGCTETQISFENNIEAGYENPSAPADETCNVFSINGGGVNFETLAQDILDTSESANTFYGHWHFDANHCVANVGTYNDSACLESETDLVTTVHYLQKSVCVAINDLLGVENPSSNPPIENSSHSGRFTGPYSPAGNILLGNEALELVGQKAGCYQDNTGYSDEAYIFYRTLVAR